MGKKTPRKALDGETVETYNLKDIVDEDLTKRLQDHACELNKQEPTRRIEICCWNEAIRYQLRTLEASEQEAAVHQQANHCIFLNLFTFHVRFVICFI